MIELKTKIEIKLKLKVALNPEFRIETRLIVPH